MSEAPLRAPARRHAFGAPKSCAVTRVAFVALGCALSLACKRSEESERSAPAAVSAPLPPRLVQKPDVLDAFPDPSSAPSSLTPEDGIVEPAGVLVPRRCPADMVDVGGAYCIDRYEISLVDAAQGRLLSPSYHPTRERTRQQFEFWTKRSQHDDTALARSLRVPAPPPFQLEEDFHVRAGSQARVLPNGYLTRDIAEQACEAAGKRLCSQSEWVHACRGERQTQFPYGTSYVDGQCNVNREAHPARLLHGNASIHHLDPRLPLVESDKGPLLRETGATATCQSHWGDDAIFDMVGNLDEWIDDPNGTFLGGFYSRATRDGCESVITVHGPTYFDYSLGARCCRETGSPSLSAPPLGVPAPGGVPPGTPAR